MIRLPLTVCLLATCLLAFCSPARGVADELMDESLDLDDDGPTIRLADLLQSDSGSSSSAATAAASSSRRRSRRTRPPAMIGDYFGNLAGGDSLFNCITLPFDPIGGPEVLEFRLPAPSAGGAIVGRQKIADNTNPLPRDRIFLNYSFFDNVPLVLPGVGVHRWTPGFEKTFWDQNASVELRLPVASTIPNRFFLDQPPTSGHFELGNLSLVTKFLLLVTERSSWSVGLQVALPTADPLEATTMDGQGAVRIDNDSVHLMPFLGFQIETDERTFVQCFLELDFDANGNRVAATQGDPVLRPVGKLNAPAFLYADVGLGRWLYQADTTNARITDIAARVELHYTRTLQTTDAITTPFVQIGEASRNVQTLNAVVGATFRSPRASVTVGYAVPVEGGRDEQFDGELRVFYNRFFGPTN